MKEYQFVHYADYMAGAVLEIINEQAVKGWRVVATINNDTIIMEREATPPLPSVSGAAAARSEKP